MAESITRESYAITGLPGATLSGRIVGVVSGSAPTSGNFLAGDFVIDQAGSSWVCISGGNPGSWTKTGTVFSGGTISGNLTIASGLTVSGNVSLLGLTNFSTNTINAAGTTQGTATAITAQVSSVTGATATSNGGAGTGVVLPATVASGSVFYIDNGDPTHWLIIYPGGSGTIDGAAASSGVWLPPSAYWTGVAETGGSTASWASFVGGFVAPSNQLSIAYGNGQTIFSLANPLTTSGALTVTSGLTVSGNTTLVSGIITQSGNANFATFDQTLMNIMGAW